MDSAYPNIIAANLSEHGIKVNSDKSFITEDTQWLIYSTNIGGDAVVAFTSQITNKCYYTRVSYKHKLSLDIFERFFTQVVLEQNDEMPQKLSEIERSKKFHNAKQREMEQLSSIQINLGSNDFGEHSVSNKVIDKITQIESVYSQGVHFEIERILTPKSDSFCYTFDGFLKDGAIFVQMENYF